MVIDLKQRYLEILEIIKSEKQRAEKDFESEITLFNKQLSEDFGKTIKVLLEWKLNHQKALSLGYNKLSSYISKNALKLKVVGETEAFEKFFIVCEGLGYVSRDNVFEVKRLRQEAYEAIKAEKFYQALGFLSNTLIIMVIHLSNYR